MATPTISLDRTDAYDPPAEHVRLREDAPISWVELTDGRRLWVLTRHEDVRTMLGDPGSVRTAGTLATRITCPTSALITARS